MEVKSYIKNCAIFKRNFYTSYVQNVSIVEQNQEIKIIDYEDDVKDKIQAITFIQSTIYYIPKGFSRYYLNLSIVEMNNCGLKSISREDLEGLEKIKELWVENNHLVSLLSNLFTNMKQLEMISFANNKLQFMTSRLFQPIMKNLKQVSLASNWKIAATFDSIRQEGVSLTEPMRMIDTQCYKPAEDGPFLNDEKFPEELCKGFSELWMSGRLPDFVINAKDSKSFKVHKNVLAINSSVLGRMLESDVEETRTGTMHIPDFQASTVEHFLCFLYTGRIPDITNVMDLYVMADKYAVENLKAISRENIMNNIIEENANEVFRFGHKHSDVDIKKRSFAVIKKMFPGKSMGDELMDNPEHLRKMIEAKRSHESTIKEAGEALQAAVRIRDQKVQGAEDDYQAAVNKHDRKIQEAQYAIDDLF